jgi:hypothetical protein
MNQDNLLEEIFSNYKPTLSDNDEFMKSLSQKLDAVEYVRSYQKQQKSRYRRYILTALVTGIVLGGISTVILMMMSPTVSLISFSIQSDVVKLITENSRFIAIVLVSMLMSAAVFAILISMQEIDSYRSMRQKEKIIEES